MPQIVCPLVSAEDRARLEAIVADRNRAQKHVARARIILGSADRLKVAEVARRAGVGRPAVWRWQRRFAEAGVEGLLRDASRKPGKAPLGDQTVRRVVTLTCAAPPGEATHWTGRAMARHTGVSLRSVQRIWAAHDLQPHRIRTAAHAIGEEWKRADTLAALAPQLPPQLLAKALNAARAIEEEVDRARALAVLAPYLAPEEKSAVLAEALTAAHAIGEEWKRADTLAALAPQLPPQLLAEALTAARAIEKEWDRADTLAALAPHLPPQLLAEALTAARAIGKERGRGRVLAALALQLPPEERPAVLAEALDAVLAPEPLPDADLFEAPDYESPLRAGFGSEPNNERRISIWLGERSPVTSKMQLNVTYTLYFKVGGPVLGSLVSGPETEVPSTDVPPGGLATEWRITSKTVELAPGTPDTLIETKAIGGSTTWTARFSLLIPEEGESAVPRLRITPTSREARLDVMISTRSEVYRQFGVELAIQAAAAASAAGVVSLRDEVIHAPAGQLELQPAHEWMTPPGALTIAVVGGTIASAHGDAGAKAIGQTTQWDGVQARVAGKIDNVRTTAERFRATWGDYLNDIGSEDLAYRLDRWAPEYDWGTLGSYADADHRRRWDEVGRSQELRDLAFDGHRLYEAFFPANSDLRSWIDTLAFGQRLNILWLPRGNPGWVPHVPWGLMYLPDVPGPGEPVDPMGFLALRLRVGYTAHPVQALSKGLGSLDKTYGANFLYWGDNPDDLTGLEARWQQQLWAALKNQVFIPTAPGPTAKAELLRLLNEPEPAPVSVLYLFCQCNVGDGSDPVLRFGSTSQPADVLRRTELGTKLLKSQPLVFANACTTAAGDPYLANELEDIFFDRGCRAYLGTEAKVPIRLASRFASVFFHFFYRRADPAPMAAGEAAAQARLFLWTQYLNIGGLFYTYVNQYELFMADDAEVVALRM